MPTSKDRFDLLSPTQLELIMRPGSLDGLIAGTMDKKKQALILQLAEIYREYFEPGFDQDCPYCIDRMIKYFKRRRESKINADNDLRRRVQLIPANERNEVLDTNMIELAKPLHNDAAMFYLAELWRRFIDADFRGDCDKCFATVLTELKAMLPFFKELRANEELLTGL